MTAPLASLPPLDATRAPEGGEVGAVQSGWRLALREFAEQPAGRRRRRHPAVLRAVLLRRPGLLPRQPAAPRTCSSHTTRPGAGHPLGTDDQGFDVLGRLMKGGQAALEIGFFAAFVAIVIGALYGAVAGLAGGVIDAA